MFKRTSEEICYVRTLFVSEASSSFNHSETVPQYNITFFIDMLNYYIALTVKGDMLTSCNLSRKFCNEFNRKSR